MGLNSLNNYLVIPTIVRMCECEARQWLTESSGILKSNYKWSFIWCDRGGLLRVCACELERTIVSTYLTTGHWCQNLKPYYHLFLITWLSANQIH